MLSVLASGGSGVGLAEGDQLGLVRCGAGARSSRIASREELHAKAPGSTAPAVAPLSPRTGAGRAALASSD